MPKVLVCDPYDPEGLEKLRTHGFEVDERPKISAEELLRIVGEYDALMVRSRTKVTKQVLENAKRLKAVARAGVGLDNIDVDHAKQKGVKVVATPEASTSSVTELTLTLMLCVLRQVSFADRNLKEQKWVKSSITGLELKSKIVGVIGAGGRIGGEVARILRTGFGCHVLGYDAVDIRKRGTELGMEVVQRLEDLLARSDIVTIHVPYLPSTHHLLNESTIKMMKSNSIIINTSRGDVVDGQAILGALQSGRLGGAGLDVFHDEPPKEEWEKQLVQLPNTVCTPHIGAQTEECQRIGGLMAAEKLIEMLKP